MKSHISTPLCNCNKALVVRQDATPQIARVIPFTERISVVGTVQWRRTRRVETSSNALENGARRGFLRPLVRSLVAPCATLERGSPRAPTAHIGARARGTRPSFLCLAPRHLYRLGPIRRRRRPCQSWLPDSLVAIWKASETVAGACEPGNALGRPLWRTLQPLFRPTDSAAAR